MFRNYLIRITILCITTMISIFAIAEEPFLLGRGMADVTGPARGIQMWGFVREGQVTEGIHTRQYSRAFVIAEGKTQEDRIAFVSVDIGSITHEMQLEIVDRLQKLYGDTYSAHNVIISATHTHAGSGGFWHWGAGSPLGTLFMQDHFDAIIDGIMDSIKLAHDDLEPGSIFVDRGTVEGAGANRSLVAYEANPSDERARYDAPTDKGMTLLKLVDASGPIGMINWFASHPTAMTFNNKLISSDHKGYASIQFEHDFDKGFVAAFAQSNCGDVSPNLNLNNTGPGENEFETTRIIAERQLDVARKLFTSASTPLSGQIESHQLSVNFKYRDVDAAYTGGAGKQRTCPSALGYSMAAGSTEDGGGHPMFKEGMTKRIPMIDGTIKTTYKMIEPSDECRECHGNKPILFPTGETVPVSQTQVLPITLTRIGSLAFASVAAEVTTMAGRRLRDTISAALDIPANDVILIGYANDYGGYLTTKEEYDTQQYEGGHTLFGPWSLAAYQQEFDHLAKAMVSGEKLGSPAQAIDQRGTITSSPLIAPSEMTKSSTEAGTVSEQPKRKVTIGDTVEAIFHAIDPRENYPNHNSYVTVEMSKAERWTPIATDRDWAMKIRWLPAEKNPEELLLHVTWDIPEGTPAGEYRIVYKDGNHTGATRTFKSRS
jgi:neutral ceramidase